jgi:hypothetical protein
MMALFMPVIHRNMAEDVKVKVSQMCILKLAKAAPCRTVLDFSSNVNSKPKRQILTCVTGRTWGRSTKQDLNERGRRPDVVLLQGNQSPARMRAQVRSSAASRSARHLTEGAHRS